MVFKAGESGNPGGNRPRKLFVDALHAIVSQKPTDIGGVPPLPEKATVAHLMAQKLVEGALRNDWKPGESLAYMQEICDRAYGKPKQAVVGGDEDDAPIRIQTESDEAVIARYLAKQKET